MNTFVSSPPHRTPSIDKRSAGHPECISLVASQYWYTVSLKMFEAFVSLKRVVPEPCFYMTFAADR